MYNAQKIEEFLEKVNNEATEAAQAVFNSYQTELQELIEREVNTGDRVVFDREIFVDTKSDDDETSDFEDQLIELQRWNKIRAGFRVPKTFTK